MLKESSAYILMRPLLNDIPDDELPGYEKGKLFFLDPLIHSRIHDSLISIPKVFPGDTVWWHPDLVHRYLNQIALIIWKYNLSHLNLDNDSFLINFSVEPVHNGKATNTVLYIPVGPDCPINRLYVERMKFQFLSGLSPPDFEGKPENEKCFKGRASFLDLSSEGMKMMGFQASHYLNIDED